MTNKELSNDEILSLCPAAGAAVPHSLVSKRYTFVPTITAINLLRDAGWVPGFASQARVNKQERFGFQKHLIRLTHRENILQSSDNRMDILLYNSHDRGCSFQLMAGIYRFVCSNGLVIGDTSMHFRHRHINFNHDDFVNDYGWDSKLAAAWLPFYNDCGLPGKVFLVHLQQQNKRPTYTF